MRTTRRSSPIPRFLPPRAVVLGLLGLAWIPLAGCQKQVSDARIDVITFREAVGFHARSLGKDAEAVFIDARRSTIYEQGTIEGAINLRPNDVDLRAGTDPGLAEREALVVFGQNPGSAVARAMCKRLLEAGYNSLLKSRVKFYPGGYDEWLEAGLPITEPAPTPDDTEPPRPAS